jgi:DNA-binding response OmpR family regulator
MEKILVVNNDFDTMVLLKNWLEKKAYDVEYTGDRNAVPHLIRKMNPHLVLVDILQRDVVEELKGDDETRAIPILLMTGYTVRHKFSQLPADDVIEKPFNLNLLEKKIEKLIYKKENDFTFI